MVLSTGVVLSTGTITITEERVVPLRSSEDVVRLRQVVREQAVALKFSLVDQTKVVTAASELARNTVIYGKGGDAHVSLLLNGGKHGLRLRFVDQGPGIADVELAMKDGYTSGGGLGLGLGGAKRLSDDIKIVTGPAGTSISITKWKPF
ncbi:MAG: anti-sigma regulatory factor [Betaproteobacteria bacterium]|nr:anti-sigma regulatory factor [Betaproteobacteria bacterium]